MIEGKNHRYKFDKKTDRQTDRQTDKQTWRKQINVMSIYIAHKTTTELQLAIFTECAHSA